MASKVNSNKKEEEIKSMWYTLNCNPGRAYDPSEGTRVNYPYAPIPLNQLKCIH